MYFKMPFGLMNAWATFHITMDYAFADEINRFIVIYLDDIIVFSKIDEDNLPHLRRIFEKCGKYGISLNTRKNIFDLKEGKF